MNSINLSISKDLNRVPDDKYSKIWSQITKPIMANVDQLWWLSGLSGNLEIFKDR